MRIDRALDEFRVPFTGLKDGHHTFSFHLGDAFFEAFEYSEMEGANIEVRTELEKTPTLMVWDSTLLGTVMVNCDRCSDPMEQSIGGTFRLVAKFGEQTREADEDDVIILGPQEFQVDLSHFFFEYANLCMPARRVHARMEDCNQEVLAKLESMSTPENSESRWIALKNMEAGGPEPHDDEFEEEE